MRCIKFGWRKLTRTYPLSMSNIKRQTSWLGVSTLEMVGQKNLCRNSYCLQRNLRGGLQFCQRQANCIPYCCHCLSSLLVVAVVIVCRCWSSLFVLFVHCCCCCCFLSLLFVAFVIFCCQVDCCSIHCMFCCRCLPVSLFVIIVGLCCCCWLSSVVIIRCRHSLSLNNIFVIVRCLCHLSWSSWSLHCLLHVLLLLSVIAIVCCCRRSLSLLLVVVVVDRCCSSFPNVGRQ